MATQDLAIALCRVSTLEQEQNHSLSRQRDAVIKAAQELNVKIPDDAWWSGSVSSKRGTNVNRKDLQEITERIKKDKRFKFVIVDEPDRFMRSINEAAYFEVSFELMGVQVWYASDPELNKGDLASKLLKFTKYLSAEGSNEERQHKSIVGQSKALLDGRFPFSPKPGYRRGYERGIQEIHPVRGPALRQVLLNVASHLVTPTQGLIDLNKSDFMREGRGHAPYKMDKFRKILTDPFYAGIVEIDKQVKVRNENGLHEPLITIAQHEELIRIMQGKKKNQTGPRKNGNPKYPLSNHVTCDLCLGKPKCRFVGFDNSNGKSPKIYEKYRCRSCARWLSREELHGKVEKYFKQHAITTKGMEALVKALNTVWDLREGQAEQEARRLKHKIENFNAAIANQVEAATDPSNYEIKQNILDSIAKKKNEISNLEYELSNIKHTADADKERFIRFALNFVNNMGSEFMTIPPAQRLRCKQLLFPAGFHLDADNRVYTPEISPIYGLATKKKSAEALDNSHLVRVKGL
jgi:hypothetical protein